MSARKVSQLKKVRLVHGQKSMGDFFKVSSSSFYADVVKKSIDVARGLGADAGIENDAKCSPSPNDDPSVQQDSSIPQEVCISKEICIVEMNKKANKCQSEDSRVNIFKQHWIDASQKNIQKDDCI